MSLQDDADDVLTPYDVAEMLKLHLKTIYKLAKTGKIPSARVGRSWRFSKRRLLEFLHEPQETKAEE